MGNGTTEMLSGGGGVGGIIGGVVGVGVVIVLLMVGITVAVLVLKRQRSLKTDENASTINFPNSAFAVVGTYVKSNNGYFTLWKLTSV
jgi:glycerol-3-phosphate acyltransferase PlsY